MPFKRRHSIRAETITDNKVTENVKEFNYLGCSLLYVNNNEIRNKLHFNRYVEKFDTLHNK
jgi:hypothetical protein